jgi:DedD protein
MARSISDEELQLKKRARRRLLGAIVLVTIAAVVLPMVLDSEPRQISQDVSIKIPAPDSGTFTSKVVPVAPPATSKSAPAKPPAPAADSKPRQPPVAGGPAAVKEAAKPAAVTAAKENGAKDGAAADSGAKESGKDTGARASASKDAVIKDGSAKAGAADQGKGQFVVQVVALSDAAKAKQIRQQISAAGIKSYTEVVKTAKGDVTRVRAGPFATRAAAEKARDQLKTMGLNGNVAAK